MNSNPNELVEHAKRWATMSLHQNCELLTERKILHSRILTAANEASQCSERELRRDSTWLRALPDHWQGDCDKRLILWPDRILPSHSWRALHVNGNAVSY
jgi:hypothetical protein